MELYQLRTFIIVAEEQNVTKAAKRLFTTPPSVSAHIKALEDELQVQLFERTPKGMKITEKGEILRTKAEQTLLAAQDMANHATRLQQHLLGTLNVGINATPSFLQIAQLVTAMQQNSPGVDLNLVSTSSGKILEMLQSGDLDIGTIFGPSQTETITLRKLHTVTLVIAIPKAWQVQPTTWEEIAALPWIMSNDYCPFCAITNDLFKQHQVTVQQVVQSNDEQTKCELVIAGVGISLLEKSEAEQARNDGNLAIWGDTTPIECDLSLAYSVNREGDPLIQAIVSSWQRLWPTELEA
ncbi:MAG: LysR family transcriptional regulator [Chloroflexota bacterium]